MRTFLPILLAPFVFAACGGPSLGKELTRDMPYGRATISHTEAVDDATADRVFQVMLDSAYNFASNLPEQIDRVNGRLTLRLGNDNEDSIAGIVKNGTAEPVVRYFEGLAFAVSKGIGGEPVDIVLCRKSIAEPFFTVTWSQPK